MEPNLARLCARRTLAIALFLAAVLLNACGSGTTGSSSVIPAQSLPLTTDTAHYTFHYSPGDAVDTARQETYYAWAIATLSVQPQRKIDYYKYRDRSQMQSLTGQLANGWADTPSFAVHSIWPWDNHEVIHVYTALVGRPSDYFNEGIAVAMETDPANGDLVPRWSGTPLHTLARNFLQAGQLAHVQDVDDTDSFRKTDDGVSYPMAGSFVEFLIERYGMPRVMDFFRTGNRSDSRSTIAANFQQAFGISIVDADLAWRTFLATP